MDFLNETVSHVQKVEITYDGLSKGFTKMVKRQESHTLLRLFRYKRI